MGLPGDEPEQYIKDYIKKCYYFYPRGVYWFNATDKLMLETSVKLADRVSQNIAIAVTS